MDKLEADDIGQRIEALPEWSLNGESIQRTFSNEDFPASMAFVEAVASLAEEAQHHPDILIRWNKVTLTLTTHDAGGLTEADFKLAARIDQVAS